MSDVHVRVRENRKRIPPNYHYLITAVSFQEVKLSEIGPELTNVRINFLTCFFMFISFICFCHSHPNIFSVFQTIACLCCRQQKQNVRIICFDQQVQQEEKDDICFCEHFFFGSHLLKAQLEVKAYLMIFLVEFIS